MKLRFVTDHISSSGVVRRAGDVRDYPEGVADLLIRRKKAEAVTDEPKPVSPHKPKFKRLDP